jgi:hypothetical protein
MPGRVGVAFSYEIWPLLGLAVAVALARPVWRWLTAQDRDN